MDKMFGFDELYLKKIGGDITTKEIRQQPRLWKETIQIIKKDKEKVEKFLNKALKEDNLKIILTGAGTSAFVGESLVTYLNKKLTHKVEAIATTDIVSNPEDYLKSDIPTLLISFARSGNSPESVAVLDVAEKIVDNLYQMSITCNSEGSLAKKASKSDKNLLVLMPEDSNDDGFAMTGSFTCMVLSTLIIFDLDNIKNIESNIENISIHAESMLSNRYEEIKKIIANDFDRAIFLGSSELKGLARESALKVLELTRGKVMTNWDSSLGFRHGPKSVINDKTLIFSYLSNNQYTRKYEIDFLKEIDNKIGEAKVIAVSDYKDKQVDELVDFSINIRESKYNYDDDLYLLFNFVLVAQMFALFKSIDLGISPDNPSIDGSVNRVVKGVTIYPYCE